MHEHYEFCCGLGDALQRARKEKHMTQEQIADALDISVRTIQKIEHHKGNPTLEILYSLIRLLDIDPRICFYPEMQPSNPAYQNMTFFLDTCSEEEIAFLQSVCEPALKAYRTKSQTNENKKEPAFSGI